jgi:neutral ceramidase
MSHLKAGAAATDITPPLGTSLAGYFHDRTAADVHDNTFCRALVLDNGDARIAIACCDLIAAERKYLDRAKAIIADRSQIPPDHVLICCTHTHTGPSPCGLLGTPGEPAYMEWLVPRIADAVQLAVNRLQEARIGHGVGSEPSQVFNRRYLLKDGRVVMNPGRHNPDIVKPMGPTDPDVTVLVAETPDREPIGLVANYTLHYVGTPEATAVSADYFGAFGRAVQRMVGKPFVAMMTNGCCGDVNNVDVYHDQPGEDTPYGRMHKVANILAAEAIKAWRQMEFADSARLRGKAAELTVQRRTTPPDQLEADRKPAAASPADADWHDLAYARERLLVDRLPLSERTWVSALSVNDLALVGLPGEIFVEHGLEIKKRSPFKQTATVELSNDYVGYVPTPKAFEEGSYETELARSSRLAPESGPAMVDEALKLLGGIAP